MPSNLEAKTCQWTNQSDALAAFAEFMGKTQSASHIKPLHWYVACRLVIEGGFDPDDIVPRPPFRKSAVPESRLFSNTNRRRHAVASGLSLAA